VEVVERCRMLQPTFLYNGASRLPLPPMHEI
jgi:hypothetical protein